MISISGCGKSTEKTAPTQVAAKVNADEISVHQINAILTKTPGIRPENATQAKREILDKLIEQQLAVQQAIELRLDRTPEVMQMIEAARAEILARAYQAQVANAEPAATTDEIRKFYQDHPELFAQRQIFNLQEMTLATDPTTLALIKPLMERDESIENIALSLKAKGVAFEANAVARGAEQIPLEFLPKYLNLKNGQVMVIETPHATILTSLVSAQHQPLDEETATPQIRNFLANQRSTEAIARDMKQLRAKSRIELVGEFSAPLPTDMNTQAAPGTQGKAIEKGVVNLR